MGAVRGVICHHTATAAAGNMPTLGVLTRGRADLRGPLSQLGLGRDGTFYVIAAGRANHAGLGSWEGVTSGNSSFIGIEAENSGRREDPWPDVQIDAYRRGAAAILRQVGAGANMCCGHKEYALPRGRKPDPTFDMAAFRTAVADLLAGATPPPPIPAVDRKLRPTIRRGDRGAAVRRLQEALGLDPDTVFGPQTEAKVRAFQREHGLVPDGIVGPKSWEALDRPPG
jgi:N-acetyl-anhydromuramyl-L-alanine amidase AmpD